MLTATLKGEALKLTDWQAKYHPGFLEDLKRLSKKDLEAFQKKRKKIIDNPLRQKHLRKADNCYREPVTKNIRIVYHVHEKSIWFLTIKKHDSAYDEFRKRLSNIKEKYV